MSRREGHDASAFYARFTPPVLSGDAAVARGPELDPKLIAGIGDGCICGDSRQMTELPDASVALVVTSPPYFVGKAYEDALAAGSDRRVPTSYFDYLEMLAEVFAECVRVLEPGGRMAVNVANLGRKPYRSLSGDVARIFEELGLLLRGEIVWRKSKGSSGSCAWGSFRSPSNPTLRDITERIVVASKGRFDRARPASTREAEGLPHRTSLSTDEFMEATLDVWDMAPESAQRVRHPAPFPLELPRRLIDLYTYENDLVLDPFMGSGTTLVASVLCGRLPVGYDLDPDYVELARTRVAGAHVSWKLRQHPAEQAELFHEDGPAGATADPNGDRDVSGDAAAGIASAGSAASSVSAGSSGEKLVASPDPSAGTLLAVKATGAGSTNGASLGNGAGKTVTDAMTADGFAKQAVAAGRKAHDIAAGLLEGCGFKVLCSPAKLRGRGVNFSFLLEDESDGQWWVDVAGAFTTVRPGLLRADTLWKMLGRSSVLAAAEPSAKLLVLTPHLPRPGSETERALRTMGPSAVFDALEMFDDAGAARLAHYAKGADRPLPGFWTEPELDARI